MGIGILNMARRIARRCASRFTQNLCCDYSIQQQAGFCNNFVFHVNGCLGAAWLHTSASAECLQLLISSAIYTAALSAYR